MTLKILTAIFVTLSIIRASFGGNAMCEYKIIDNQGYSCKLSAMAFDSPIIFASFVEKFDEIHGDHVQGASDDNVTVIENSNNFNPFYFPKIICEKFSQLQEIVIRNSEIEKILIGSLENCKQLIKFEVSSSKLTRLDDELLKNCEFLRDLTFADSNIRHVPVDLLTSCKNLRKLNLSGNKLKLMTENLLKNQENLEILNLSRNKIQGFPKNFFKFLKNLQILDLSNNSIAVVSTNWLKPLSNLIELNLSQNSIQTIPKSFITFPYLKVFDLSSNAFQYIHSDSFIVYPSVTILSDNVHLAGIEERFVKNILNASKTLKIFKTLCTRDRMILGGHDFLENQTNEQLLEFLDNCFDEYEPRNEDEGEFVKIRLLVRSFND